MGLIHLPRAYFKGFTYWNPSTINNNDYQPLYDAANARLNWPWIERHGLRNPEDFDRYAITPTIATANASADLNLVAGKPPAEWNYYGGLQCGFVGPEVPVVERPEYFAKPDGNLGITGFTNPAGALVQQGDPWIGLPLRMGQQPSQAKLVDLDPICPWSTQIFADSFTLGSADPAHGAGVGSGAGFSALTAGRAHSRWVFFARNANLQKDVLIAGIGAAAWQFVLPTETLHRFDKNPAPGSLAAYVQQALAQPGVQGLMLRFVTYLTRYFQGPAFPPPHTDKQCFAEISRIYAEYAQQLARFSRGEQAEPTPPPINRAYSSTVGWIAPWYAGELQSMPGGRYLPGGAPATVVAPAGLGQWPVGPMVVEAALDPNAPQTVARISLDLGSTVAEADSSAAKINFGLLHIGLAALDSPGTPVKTIATVPYAGGYDQAAYERTAGVVDIPAAQFNAPLSAAELQGHLLVGWFGDGPAVLQEQALVAQTDDRGVYLDEPDAPWPLDPHGDDARIVVQVRYLGGKPPPGTRLGFAQYSPSTPGFNEMAWTLVDDSPGSTAQTPYVRMIGPQGQTSIRQLLLTLEDGADRPYSELAVHLHALRCGPPVIAFYPLLPSTGGPVWAPPPSVQIMQITTAYFANARVLPFHNALALDFENWLRIGPTLDIVSQRVFDDVFRTYCLMYPVMRFLGDPLRFQAWRGHILAATDPALFGSNRYMPVTRSLSAGQRRMLVLWQQYTDGDKPTPLAPPAVARRG